MVETATLQQLETFGAGAVALVTIFGIIWMIIKQIVPTLKIIGESLIKTVNALSISIDVLNKTMLDMQTASIASIHSLEKEIKNMQITLDYHIEAALRIERSIQSLTNSTTEIKERVRNCGNGREPTLRTREEDK